MIRNKIKKILFPGEPVEKSNMKSFANVDIQEGSTVSWDSSVGEYTYVGRNTNITKSVIGRYCSIANNVSIGDGEHALNKISTNSLFYENPYEELTSNECILGNDVWIGTQCIIRRGVKIGNGAVVGANSFVNKDVPDFAIVAGTPARILKYRFNESDIELINKSEWWNMDLATAKKEIEKLQENISK